MTQTADWSELATRTLDTLLERRSGLSDAHSDGEDDALERFVVAAVAADEVWTEGARRIEELEQQAERIRDDMRDRAAVLETEQAKAIMDLLHLRPIEEVAALLGTSVEQLGELVRVPQPRDSLPA
jgi:hypothetical protein